MATADVDYDGDLDIIAGNQFEQSAVYLNDGAGNFYTGAFDCLSPTTVRCFGSASEDAQSVAVGDMNGDGDLDLVTGSSGRGRIYLNAAGYFDVPGNTISFEDSPYNIQSVAVGDVDGDGDLDIVTGEGDGSGSGTLNFVYLNDGYNSLLFSQRTFGPGGDDTRSVAVGDMDGDGDLDLAAGNWAQQNVVYLNDGAGNLPAGQDVGDPADTRSVAVGDVNGDGYQDVVMGRYGEQSKVYLNDGVGNFPNVGFTTGQFLNDG